MPGPARLIRNPLQFLLAPLGVVLFASTLCRPQGFPPVSPDELKMTSEPQAPGAPAVILFREVDCDDNRIRSREDNYMRIKVLTEEGRKQADIEIPFLKSTEEVTNIHARTIHPDGTSIDFNGHILESTIAKTRGLKYLAKTLTLPDVQVGSIIEYRYTINLREDLTFNTHWILSSQLFTKEAKFSLKPYQSSAGSLALRWTWQGIQAGSAPQQGPDHVVRLDVQNIPAFETEDYMPPPNQLKERVDFIYEGEFMENNPDAFWQHVGKSRYQALESYVDRRKAMEGAVAQIVAPSDSAEAKLRKIYERVQKFRNTSYAASKSAEEEKRLKDKPAENVEEVWKHGYGSYTQLNWLFLALSRAAGFDARAVWVSNREEYFFNPKYMENRKLSSCVVLVKVDGRDLYFEPGNPFAPFGMLSWSLAGTPGLCLDPQGGTWVNTPLPKSSESRVEHRAKFQLSDNGDLKGNVTVTYTGLEALYHRLDVRDDDEVARKKFLEDRVRSEVPMSAHVELIAQPDWNHPEAPLVAEFHLTIPGWASPAGRRELMPVGVFAGTEKRLFERENRVHPIYIEYPHQKIDDVAIELPAGWQVSSEPSPQSIDGHIVKYSLQVENDHMVLHLTRQLDWDFMFLEQKYYNSLRNFFQAVRTFDDQQILLQPPAAAGGN
jgi:transglutaminase-like putative cysteine protease